MLRGDHEAVLAKDDQAVFLCRFFQMLRCTRGQMGYQRWLIKYEIARTKAIEAWLDITTPRAAVDHLDVVAEVVRLRQQSESANKPKFARPSLVQLEVYKPPSTELHCQTLPMPCMKLHRRLSGEDTV